MTEWGYSSGGEGFGGGSNQAKWDLPSPRPFQVNSPSLGVKEIIYICYILLIDAFLQSLFQSNAQVPHGFVIN